MYISNISISLIIAISPCVESLLVAANFCFWDKDFFSDFSGCWSQCGRSFSQPALTCCVVSIRPLLTHCCVYCQLSGGLTKLWGIANLLHHLVEWRGTKTTHAKVFLCLTSFTNGYQIGSWLIFIGHLVTFWLVLLHFHNFWIIYNLYVLEHFYEDSKLEMQWACNFAAWNWNLLQTLLRSEYVIFSRIYQPFFN